MAAELTSIEPLREVIRRKPLGIFSDIDGTLAPIVRDPAKSRISPRAKELLEGLIERDVRVALVSGREIDAARRIVGLDNVAYAGNHGLHVRLDGAEETTEAV
ncbi:MAG TPA: trehalose-phosphatase, partial [Dehalococcoidia bacterium]|nr:trehalose-phosphatase [Dehalococcoidia bacterium]